MFTHRGKRSLGYECKVEKVTAGSWTRRSRRAAAGSSFFPARSCLSAPAAFMTANPMSKSYRMVVLLAMLDRGPDKWYQPMTPEEATPYFYEYLMAKEYRKLRDFSDKKTTRLWQYDAGRVAQLVADMPMTKWANGSKGLIAFDGTTFAIQVDFEKESAKARESVFHWTNEIAEYRLAFYFERKSVLAPG